MASVALFYTDEELTSADLQNGFSILSSSMSTQVTQLLYSSSFVILNGLTPAQSATADNGIQISAGLAYQNGDPILLSSQQGVNILPGSYANGTGLAADSTYSRIDVVYVQYATTQTNQQTRTFNPPNQSSYTQSVYTEQVDGYTLSVVHGTASASPVVPSIPAGSVALAQVTVPANATTITTADISDQTAQYRNDGGRLALATNGLLSYVNSTTLGTPSGFRLGLGDTAYLIDNTSGSTLDIHGGSNGITAYSAWKYVQSGTPMVFQPSSDATSGTHVVSWRNASGTEYAWIDNAGNASFVPTINAATPTSLGTVEVAQNPASGDPVAVIRAADAEEQTISTAGSWVTVASFTPTQNGFFDIDTHFRLTANSTVEWQVTYAGSQSAQTTQILNQTSYTYASGGDNDYDTLPVSVRAVSGTAINVQIQVGTASAVVASANITGR